MKRHLFAFVLGLTIAADASAEAQQVHAIIIANTKAENIAVGIQANYQTITSFMSALHEVGGIDVKQHYVIGDDFSCTRIMDEVKNVQLGPDDTVFFYYAGHGYRTPSTPTKFPDFDCARPSDPQGAATGMSWVVKTLTDKHPRFIVALADTCNVLFENPPLPGVRAAPVILPEALRRLFLRYRGAIVMSGSAPGLPSWYRNDSKAGGLFTQQFNEALLDNLGTAGEANNPELARWSTITDAAAKPIIGDPTHHQEPQLDRKISVEPLLQVAAPSAN